MLKHFMYSYWLNGFDFEKPYIKKIGRALQLITLILFAAAFCYDLLSRSW